MTVKYLPGRKWVYMWSKAEEWWGNGLLTIPSLFYKARIYGVQYSQWSFWFQIKLFSSANTALKWHLLGNQRFTIMCLICFNVEVLGSHSVNRFEPIKCLDFQMAKYSIQWQYHSSVSVIPTYIMIWYCLNHIPCLFKEYMLLSSWHCQHKVLIWILLKQTSKMYIFLNTNLL